MCPRSVCRVVIRSTWLAGQCAEFSLRSLSMALGIKTSRDIAGKAAMQVLASAFTTNNQTFLVTVRRTKTPQKRIRCKTRLGQLTARKTSDRQQPLRFVPDSGREGFPAVRENVEAASIASPDKTRGSHHSVPTHRGEIVPPVGLSPRFSWGELDGCRWLEIEERRTR